MPSNRWLVGRWKNRSKIQLGGPTYEQMERAMELDEKGAIAIGSDVELLDKYLRYGKQTYIK